MKILNETIQGSFPDVSNLHSKPHSELDGEQRASQDIIELTEALQNSQLRVPATKK
jgi:hypothetical protein